METPILITIHEQSLWKKIKLLIKVYWYHVWNLDKILYDAFYAESPSKQFVADKDIFLIASDVQKEQQDVRHTSTYISTPERRELKIIQNGKLIPGNVDRLIGYNVMPEKEEAYGYSSGYTAPREYMSREEARDRIIREQVRKQVEEIRRGRN